MSAVLVALAGGLGAVVRFLVDAAIARRAALDKTAPAYRSRAR